MADRYNSGSKSWTKRTYFSFFSLPPLLFFSSSSFLSFIFFIHGWKILERLHRMHGVGVGGSGPFATLWICPWAVGQVAMDFTTINLKKLRKQMLKRSHGYYLLHYCISKLIYTMWTRPCGLRTGHVRDSQILHYIHHFFWCITSIIYCLDIRAITGSLAAP